MIFFLWGIAFLIFMVMAIKFGFFLLSPVIFIIGVLWNMILSLIEAVFHAFLSLFRKNKAVGLIATIIIVMVLYRIFFRY